MVKGLLQLGKGYGLCKGLLLLQSLLIESVIISVYLLCMGILSLIIGDQEDESIWKILAVEN